MSVLTVQRRLTKAIIDDDPTEIILTPYNMAITTGGGRSLEPSDPRPAQRFKVIPMTYDQRPTVTTGGVERIIDYTLLGEWDCDGAVGDRFTLDDLTDGYLEIVAVASGHKYEKKFLCERHLYRDGVV